MRLHWNVYGGGIANQIMSIQVGIILSFLSKRELVLYLDNNLAFSERKLKIDNLFDINCEIVYGDIPNYVWFPADFDVCYYAINKPDENFSLNRRCVDIVEFNESDIASSTKNTLGYYSFKIFLKNKLNAVNHLKQNLQIKQKYFTFAQQIYNSIGIKNSIHVRRGDFCNIDFFAENFTSSFDKCECIIYNNFHNYPILVHTNEEDKKYFNCENELVFIDRIIQERHPELDSVEVSVISMLIAIMSEKFVGSLGSTFSGLIHQNRKINNPEEKFKYLFSKNSILNRFGEEIKVNGQYTWNQLKLRHWSDCNWQREYPECYDTFTSISNAHELNLNIH